jgi:hypothetical protein
MRGKQMTELSLVQNTSLASQGLAGAAGGAATRTRTHRCYSPSGWPPSPLRAARSLKNGVGSDCPRAGEGCRSRRFLAVEPPIATDVRVVNPASLRSWQTFGDFAPSLSRVRREFSRCTEFPTGTSPGIAELGAFTRVPTQDLARFDPYTPLNLNASSLRRFNPH